MNNENFVGKNFNRKKVEKYRKQLQTTLQICNTVLPTSSWKAKVYEEKKLHLIKLLRLQDQIENCVNNARKLNFINCKMCKKANL